MTYSVYTVLNSDYMTFGRIFVNSFIDKCDQNKVDKIYILDIGLSDKDRKWLNNTSDKIEILSSDYTNLINEKTFIGWPLFDKI